MAIDIGALGMLKAQPSATVPVTDLSPEYAGGQSVATGPVTTTKDEVFILYGSVAVIVTALILLWFFGGFAFRGLPHI
jgi:hypothetical protein